MPAVLCLNGPNLDLLGSRQPEVYGSMTLPELERQVVAWGRDLDIDVECIQSNHEGELVEILHGGDEYAGVIVNPGALTHTSAAMGDAAAVVAAPVVEVHLSNVRARARWRRRSYLAPRASATIFGRGPEGYRAALRHLRHTRDHTLSTHRYGPHPDQVLDLWPGAGPTGIVLVHGGFWLDAWGRDTTEGWAADLAARGVPTANLEFRRLGSGGGLVPTLSDISRGLAEAADALATVDVVVVGHSAGAHLALNAARLSGFPAGLVVSVSGVLDLEEAAASGREGGAVSHFDPDHISSPLTGPPPAVPVLLVHGGADEVVPPDHSRRYADRWPETDHRLVVAEGVGHFAALDPGGELWSAVVSDLAGRGLLRNRLPGSDRE